MKPQAVPAVEAFATARESFESLMLFLDSRKAQAFDHEGLEQHLLRECMELQRNLLQTRLNARSEAEPICAMTNIYSKAIPSLRV